LCPIEIPRLAGLSGSSFESAGIQYWQTKLLKRLVDFTCPMNNIIFPYKWALSGIGVKKTAIL